MPTMCFESLESPFDAAVALNRWADEPFDGSGDVRGQFCWRSHAIRHDQSSPLEWVRFKCQLTCESK